MGLPSCRKKLRQPRGLLFTVLGEKNASKSLHSIWNFLRILSDSSGEPGLAYKLYFFLAISRSKFPFLSQPTKIHGCQGRLGSFFWSRKGHQILCPESSSIRNRKRDINKTSRESKPQKHYKKLQNCARFFFLFLPFSKHCNPMTNGMMKDFEMVFLLEEKGRIIGSSSLKASSISVSWWFQSTFEKNIPSIFPRFFLGWLKIHFFCKSKYFGWKSTTFFQRSPRKK